jgi:hypothetical protein
MLGNVPSAPPGPGPYSFATIVAVVIEAFPRMRLMIADEFEVAPSTVDRWARGAARPHPLVQRQVVGFMGVDQSELRQD